MLSQNLYENLCSRSKTFNQKHFCKQTGRVKKDLDESPPIQSPSPKVLGAWREFDAAYDEMESWFQILEEYQRTEFDEL